MKIYIIVTKRKKKERSWRVVKGTQGFVSNDFSSWCNRAAAAGQSPLGDLLHAFPPVLLNDLWLQLIKATPPTLPFLPHSSSPTCTKAGSGFPFYFLNPGLDLPVVINKYTEKKENCRSLLW